MEGTYIDLSLTDNLNEPIENFDKRLAEELEERTEFSWHAGSGCNSGFVCYTW